MRQYNVSFYKHILSSDGHPFRCLQRSIDVTEESEQLAIEKAKQEFETEKHVPWTYGADTMELRECAWPSLSGLK
jgi:hypothetical protein